MYAKLSPADASPTFATQALMIVDHPVFWLEAYFDSFGSFHEVPYLEQEVQPGEDEPRDAPGDRMYVWCVLRRGDELECQRVRVPDADTKPDASFALPSGGDWRVVSSTVSNAYDLHLLLADAKDQLYYASTSERKIEPIADAAGQPIGIAQSPALMTAGAFGDMPWVYVRFIKDGKQIEFARLEPEDRDPVERRTPAGARATP